MFENTAVIYFSDSYLKTYKLIFNSMPCQWIGFNVTHWAFNIRIFVSAPVRAIFFSSEPDPTAAPVKKKKGIMLLFRFDEFCFRHKSVDSMKARKMRRTKYSRPTVN